MSIVVFILSMSIILLLTRSHHQRKTFYNKNRLKTTDLTTIPTADSNPYADDILYETNKKKLLIERSHFCPIKPDSSFHSIPCPLYSTSSTFSLPSLELSAPSPPAPAIPPATPQYLSVHRLYKSYV